MGLASPDACAPERRVPLTPRIVIVGRVPRFFVNHQPDFSQEIAGDEVLDSGPLVVFEMFSHLRGESCLGGTQGLGERFDAGKSTTLS